MEIVNYQLQLDDSIVPQPVAQLPWGHNNQLIEKVKDQEPAILQQAIAKIPGLHNSIKAEMIFRDIRRPMATMVKWNQQMGNCN
jgi:hypothetical protein